VLVKRDTLKGSATSQAATGSALAITVTPESGPSKSATADASLPTETIQFVDLSNPKSPKSVKTFKGVTSVYPDDSRHLVYLVHNEGLWIISHDMTHPLPMCNSESALTPEPGCQERATLSFRLRNHELQSRMGVAEFGDFYVG
jgi:hypothetical protein